MGNPKIVKNLEIVTKEDLGTPVLYHIAMDKRKLMVPNISKRALVHEDNTMPRVCVSRNLEECIIGYDALLEVILSSLPTKESKDKEKQHVSQAEYLGGFYIHAIEYEVALKPNSRLIPDANTSNELWLVPYCKMWATYDAEVIGKMLLTRLDFVPLSRGFPEMTATIVIELKSDTPLALTDKITLNKGHWEIRIKEDRVVTHRAIKKQDFDEAKSLSANMLSLEDFKEANADSLPKFLR